MFKKGLTLFIDIVLVLVLAFATDFFLFQGNWRTWGDTLETCDVSNISVNKLNDIEKDGEQYVVSGDEPQITMSLAEPIDISTMTIDFAEQDNSDKTLFQKIGFDSGTVFHVCVSTSAMTDDETTHILLSNDASTETFMIDDGDEPVNEVTIAFKNVQSGQVLSIDNIFFNQPIPYVPSLIRFVFLILAFAFCACVRPKGILRRYGTGSKKMLHATVCISAVLLLTFTVFSLTVSHARQNEEALLSDVAHWGQQYEQQADAILLGQASLPMKVPEWLAEAENPYDYDYRCEMGTETGEPAAFDFAFYDGKYYCYFGVLPVITLYVPFKMLTGTDLSNFWANTILGILATIAILGLTSMLCRRFKRNTPASFALLSFALYLASGIPFIAFYSSVYHVAIFSSMVCAIGGITCWLRADESERVDWKWLLLGSVLMGATLLTRPASFLAVLLAFPIFWKRLFAKHGFREFFDTNRASIRNTCLVILPILALGILQMCWNYARFGSPFDFGERYNLTGFDMTDPQIVNESLVQRGLIFWFYLLAPLNLTSEFPFILNWCTSCPIPIWDFICHHTYTLIIEPYYGSILASYPFLLLSAVAIFPTTLREMHKNKSGFLFLLSIIVALIIIFVDSGVAVTQRYQADFGWLLGLSAAIAIMNHMNVLDEKGTRTATVRKNVLIILFIILIIVSMCFVLTNFFAIERYLHLDQENPQVWWAVKAWFDNIHIPSWLTIANVS